MFLWYSPAVTVPHKTGTVAVPYSTGDNYYLIKDWLGVTLAGDTAESRQRLTPLGEDYVPRQEIVILDTEQVPQIYTKLPTEKK